METRYDRHYVEARETLLDAVEALGAHRNAVILVGQTVPGDMRLHHRHLWQRPKTTLQAPPPRLTGRVDLHELLTDPSRSDTSS